MSQQFSVLLVVLVAFIAANLPFINGRLLACVPLTKKEGEHGSGKRLGLQFMEWIFLYMLTGLFSRWIESRAGQVYSQGWEFYVTTVALFATFAFPGFVYSHMTRSGE